MKDNLTEHFRNGLAGHEMDVPPGVWEHVGGQLAAAASGEALRNVLQEKFRGHEAEVDPSAWGNINGQLGNGTAAGGSFSLGWIAAGVAAVGLVAGTLYLINNNKASERATAATVPTGTTVQQSVQAPMPAAQPDMAEPKAEPVVAQPTTPTRESASLAHKSAPPVALRQIQAPTDTEPAKATESGNPAKGATEQPLAIAAPTVQTPVIAEMPDRTSGSKTDHATEPKASLEPRPAQQDQPDAAKPDRHDQPAAAQSGTEMPGGNANPFAQDEADENIFIPTAFTPNGDALNENFAVTLRDYAKVDVRVFSAKTGALVFQTNDLARTWDGRLPNGNFADEGNYQCVVNWTDHEGHSHSKNLTVRLFR